MRKLKELLAPQTDAVGYRLGWAAAPIGNTIHPLQFAKDYLAADAHFGALHATWLCLMSEEDR